MTCLFNPGACAETAFWNVIMGVPWWAWLLVILVVLGFAWKFAGIPGLVAAAAALGFAAGTFRPRVTSKKTQDEFDRQNDNSADFWPHKQPDEPAKPHGSIPGFDSDTGTWDADKK